MYTQGSLGAVGDLPHDDVTALGLGQHVLHLAHGPCTLFRLVVLPIT